MHLCCCSRASARLVCRLCSLGLLKTLHLTPTVAGSRPNLHLNRAPPLLCCVYTFAAITFFASIRNGSEDEAVRVREEQHPGMHPSCQPQAHHPSQLLPDSQRISGIHSLQRSCGGISPAGATFVCAALQPASASAANSPQLGN